MAYKKLNISKRQVFLLFIFLLINCASFAQGDPYEEEDKDNTSALDESDMYIGNTPTKSRSQDAEPSSGGLGLSISFPETNKNKQEPWQTPINKQEPAQTPINKQDPRGTNSVPPPPNSDPDAPIDGATLYLIASGLGYGGYKIMRKRM